MGDFGMAGLWLLLASALVASVLVATGSILLANRTLPKPVPTGHNWALAPFLTCVSLVYGALLGFTIGRVGAVLLRGDQRLQRGVNCYNDVPADRRHARSRADPDAGPGPQIHEGGREPGMGECDPRWQWQRKRASRAPRDGQGARQRAVQRLVGPAKSEVSRPADHFGVAAESANPGRQTANTRLAVDRAAFRRCPTTGARWLHAPGEHA